MAVFKVEKCKCGYKHNEPKPGKSNKPCPKCGATMRYLDNFYISYQIHGKKYVESAEENRRNAELALSKRKVEIKEGKFFDKKEAGISWNEAVKELEDSYRTLSPKTVSMYKNSLRVLTPLFRYLKLSDITEEHLKRYKEQRLAEGITGATFNRDRATIKRIFALNGVDWRFKKTVFGREKENKRELDLEPEDVVALEACIKLPHLVLAYLIATDTGMRKTATLSLNLNDINFKDRSIKKIGKGGKEVWVPMTHRLTQALEFYIKEHGTTHYLFPQPNNPERHMVDLKRSFKTALRTAGIKPITWHHLRHLFATNFAEKVYDPKVLQELMGHSSIDITMNIYTKTRKDHLRKRMDEYEEKTTAAHSLAPHGERAGVRGGDDVPGVNEDVIQQLINAGWTPPPADQTVH